MEEIIMITHFSRKIPAEFQLPSLFESENIDRVAALHHSMPNYTQTPLHSLNGLAKDLGVAGIYVKDESFRFGLNAFKGLGAGYAVAAILAQRLGMNAERITYKTILEKLNAQQEGKGLFVTATDGNHGRGVAWAARLFGQEAVIFMPKGSASHRVKAIEDEGAKVIIFDGNYDDAVRTADVYATEHGGILVQDTAFEGYEAIPRYIMQGYLTMADEAFHQLKEKQIRPTHIFVQAGVGSLAAAVVGYFYQAYQGNPPKFVVVEPSTVDCIYLSAKAGKREIVTGNYYTVMAGLSCGEPNPIALDILLNTATDYLSVCDEAALLGMRTLAMPREGDPSVVSGESGAGPLGAVQMILEEPKLSAVRNALGLDSQSQLLFFSTEGDTDPENYQKVVNLK
jgi:diaminopropionate ammonia-lyase